MGCQERLEVCRGASWAEETGVLRALRRWDTGIDELWLIRKAVRATLSDPDRSWILDAAVGHNVSVRSMLPISAIGRL